MAWGGGCRKVTIKFYTCIAQSGDQRLILDRLAKGDLMIVEIADLAAKIEPSKTVLILGSGSSVPSGGLSGTQLAASLASKFKLDQDGFSLSEIAQIISDKMGRAALIGDVRRQLSGLNPASGMLNLPLYGWNSIFTTNYDSVVEKAFAKVQKEVRVVSSNFDFGKGKDNDSARLYKVHGTIDRDIVDGANSRIIISDEDYDLTSEYREMIWDRLRSDLIENDCIIIGQSLANQHLKDLLSKIGELKEKAYHSTSIYILLFEADPARAALYIRKNFKVCFGGIDDFFAEMAKSDQPVLKLEGVDAIFSGLHALHPATIFVRDAVGMPSSVERMYNGWPASWADVAGGLTFQRDLAYEAEHDLMQENANFAVFLGASGTGKTTAARQCVFQLQQAGFMAWEHSPDRELLVAEWTEVARRVKDTGQFGVLFVDNAHDHLHAINALADNFNKEELFNLKIVMASQRNEWNPRIKSPFLFRNGSQYVFSTLSDREVDALISLVESQQDVRRVVEATFGSFSKAEKRRRLRQACDKDTFVCLRNIFDNEAFDDIILREFAALEDNNQKIYRFVSALESLSVKVHRQLVMRLTGIPAAAVPGVLSSLTDIVEEYSVNEREGVYGWRGRHKVITEIITKHKFHEQGAIYKLLEQVIESLSMTYDIEVRTVRNLCGSGGGISKSGTKRQQNILLQKLISQAPGERVPRHRLIANLIALGETSKAETEIRLFENDFREDGPVARYRVKLLLHRAIKAKGILPEDRKAILDKALELSKRNVRKYPGNKYVLTSFCDVGVGYLKLTGVYAVYDQAMELMRQAEKDLGDPDISRMIERYTKLVTSDAVVDTVFDDEAEIS